MREQCRSQHDDHAPDKAERHKPSTSRYERVELGCDQFGDELRHRANRHRETANDVHVRRRYDRLGTDPYQVSEPPQEAERQYEVPTVQTHLRHRQGDRELATSRVHKPPDDHGGNARQQVRYEACQRVNRGRRLLLVNATIFGTLSQSQYEVARSDQRKQQPQVDAADPCDRVIAIREDHDGRAGECHEQAVQQASLRCRLAKNAEEQFDNRQRDDYAGPRCGQSRGRQYRNQHGEHERVRRLEHATIEGGRPDLTVEDVHQAHTPAAFESTLDHRSHDQDLGDLECCRYDSKNSKEAECAHHHVP